MPDYVSSRGLAGFFDTLSKEFMDSKRQEYQNEAKIKELTTENTLEAMKQGKIQYQPQAPVASPLNLTGTPTISGSMAPPPMPVPAPTAPSMAGVGGIAPYFSGPQAAGAMPGLNVAPPVPKTQPLTLQQQNELIGSTMKGQPAADRYVTVPQEKPSGDPYETKITEGNKTTTWKNTDMTEYQSAKLDIEKNRAQNMRSGTPKDAYMAAFTQAVKLVGSDVTMIDKTQDERMKATNDIVENILQNRKDTGAGSRPEGMKKAPTNTPADTLPAGVTEQDIQHTMKARKMTRQQVLDAFNKKNKVK